MQMLKKKRNNEKKEKKKRIAFQRSQKDDAIK